MFINQIKNDLSAQTGLNRAIILISVSFTIKGTKTDRSCRNGCVFVYVWSVLPLALDFQEARVFLGALEVPCPKTNKSFISNTYIQTQHNTNRHTHNLPLAEAKLSNCEADVYSLTTWQNYCKPYLHFTAT